MKILPDAYHKLTQRLLERLDYIRIQPAAILIISRHPHQTKIDLEKRYPTAYIKTVSCAANMRNFQDESFDLLISEFSLAQENTPIYLLQECHRVLKNEGLLLLTSVGPDTFFELRQSFLNVDNAAHVHDFVDMHHVGDWLRGLHFADPVVDREEIIIAYDDLNLFFDDLKTLQVRNKHQNRARGLMTKNKWNKMLLQYTQLQNEGVFPVMIEMIYGHAWKIKIEEDDNAEVMISVDQIKRKDA